MQKHVYLIHGWGGTPEGVWRGWLKQKLESQGFVVDAPAMPDAETPRIENWIPFLKSAITQPDANTVLVGHSMGCNAIIRYLAELPEGAMVGKVVLVAGTVPGVTITHLTEEEKPIAKPWIEVPVDFSKVKRSAGEFVAFFSDNDPYIPLETADTVKEKLSAKVIVEHDKHHFGDSDDIEEVPAILAEITKSP